jgi:hypothetical protein
MTTKYQRYLARKREKGEKKETKTRPGANLPRDVERAWARNSPIHECLVPDNLFKQGIGNLSFSRLMPNGRIALGMFLLDVFCLGVKDAFFSILERYEYEARIRNWPGPERLLPMTPACLRKLVEGGVVYARDLGFEPHHDYEEARQIFGDQETASCTEHFEYGHEGKPLYISGPNETPARANAIVEQLRRHKGEGNFHFVMGVDEPEW